MARVYSSLRSCRILHTSTQHSVTIRLARLLSAKTGLPGTGMLTEAAGGAPGAADIADPSLLLVVQRAAGVVAEDVVQGHVLAERRLQVARGAGRPDMAQVHERQPVAVGVRLVHVVRRHQDGHAVFRGQQLRDVADHPAVPGAPSDALARWVGAAHDVSVCFAITGVGRARERNAKTEVRQWRQRPEP